MRTNTTRRLAAFAAVAILLVGACGDDDGDDAAVETVAETEAPAETDAPAETEAAETSVEPADTEASAQGGQAGDDNMWCGVLDETDEVEMVFTELTTLTPAEIEAGLDRVGEILPLVTDAAPPEIEADAVVVVDQAQAIIDAFADAEYNFLDVDLGAFDDADYQAEIDAANRALDDYSEENCGRPFGDPSPDPSEETPDDTGFDPGAGTLREQLVDEFVTLGLTVDEAQCVVDNADLTNPEVFLDPGSMSALLSGCNISGDRLAEISGP